ncbi:type II secretion system protein [Massilia genomosp. 1]|uniref:type II secretion system protein n=1 Tax=Massilia genomosp. 1 TaxID=2609280 RepID=UPI001651EB1D|nr:type II secretion system protein [Massilia genomosp. 1]
MPHTDRLPGMRGQGGFTYLWVLLLVAFMGLGLTVAVEVDATAARRERERELLIIGRQFQTALGRYHESELTAGKKDYPASLEELLEDRRFPGVRRHLRKIFVDPMTGNAEWGLVMLGGRIVGVHSLSDKTPIKQAGFAPEHAALRGKQKYSEWQFLYPPDLAMSEPAAGGAGAAAPPATVVPATTETTETNRQGNLK